jgi:hypothetical protein
MDIAAYRKQCLAEIRQAKADPDAPRTAKAGARKIAANRVGALSADARADALSLHASGREASTRDAMDLLADDAAGVEPRLRALAFLDAATFDPVAFASYEAGFAATLQRLATHQEQALRLAALERLALLADPLAQTLLAESLSGKRQALVPQAKAVQLLGMDAHGGAHPLLRKLATTAKGKVREEALRSLAGDPKAASLLARVGGDKTESRSVREIAAMSLKNAAPARFASLARKMVLDENEDRRLRATAMSAIAHTEAVRRIAMKPAFAKAVGTLASSRGTPAALKKSMRVAMLSDAAEPGFEVASAAPTAAKTVGKVGRNAVAKAAAKKAAKKVAKKVAKKGVGKVAARKVVKAAPKRGPGKGRTRPGRG